MKFFLQKNTVNKNVLFYPERLRKGDAGFRKQCRKHKKHLY